MPSYMTSLYVYPMFYVYPLFYFGLHAPILHYVFSESRALVAQLTSIIVGEGQ